MAIPYGNPHMEFPGGNPIWGKRASYTKNPGVALCRGPQRFFDKRNPLWGEGPFGVKTLGCRCAETTAVFVVLKAAVGGRILLGSKPWVVVVQRTPVVSS